MKQCTKCHHFKSLDMFFKEPRNKSGLKSNCKQCCRIATKNWRLKNPTAALEYNQKNKQKVFLSKQKWRKNNKGHVNFLTASRYARKKQGSLKLSKQHRLEMREIYKIAKELSWLSEGGLHVDHIVPINGKNVCGLHVPWNLQIIPASWNIKKSNKFNLRPEDCLKLNLATKII